MQELWCRVTELGGATSTGALPEDRPEVQKKMDELMERVADLEGQGPFGYVGGVPRQTRADKGRGGVSVMDSKVVMSLGQLTDCLLYTSPSPRDRQKSRMPSSA